MGKLIVLEGIDGSGKSTQFGLLCKRLTHEGTPFTHVTFPQYGKPSCALVEQYLHGDFGTHPDDVNAHAASSFYAVDRYASYKQHWQKIYDNGGLILMDRYTTSNAIHQGSKVPEAQRPDFFRWLYDFEYGLLGLPRPDMVLYLDITLDESERRRALREKATGTSADIHERDTSYLSKCIDCAHLASETLGWQVIPFEDNGRLRTADEIHEQLYALVTQLVRTS